MNTPYSTIGHADQESALLTNAAGYDVAALERVTVRAPGLPQENHLTAEEWQQLINLVDAAPAMLSALRECITEPGAACLNGTTRVLESMLLRRRIEVINQLASAAINKAIQP